jgi:hypothetical protein
VSMRARGCCGGVDARVDVDGLFSWLSDVYGVGMASGAVVRLVEVYFVWRVLI